jgi:pimeloyl-ACP methyl ester carboxylesterase
MVLVHGLGGSHVNWAAVGPLFARTHRVVAVDLPGFGRTPLLGRSSKIESNSDILARFVRAIGDEPATLVGNSMGGMLSVMTAARHPSIVSALVLVNAAHAPVLGAPIDREVALAFALYSVPKVGELFMKLRGREQTAERLVRETMQVCAAEPEKIDRALIDAHIALAEERRSMAWAHDAFLVAARSLLRALFTPGFMHRTADKVRAPTLVVHGDRDRHGDIAAARAAAQRPHGAREVLHGIGHVPQIEVPERFVSIVDAWLGEQQRGSVRRTAHGGAGPE